MENKLHALLQENEDTIATIRQKMGRDIGIQEIEFRSTFDDRETAAQARDKLRELLGSRDGVHVMIMNNFENLSQFDCLFSTEVKIDAKTVTEFEVLCSKAFIGLGGTKVTWGFLESRNTEH
ncbi:hypothetical protein BCF46_0950 [Litoreibacter meonggei]|uniref:Uncharacterized protein n=1 Tax=Litoreibacter meonggei TaxID=1049199 RepID=A0A497X672_9RHOB|nr:hypothetical protein [Litoreibacter meonggei]RLJ60745.1 hypothetical protein BCF46_0950 [Litoreibacter meonggei]